jgi:hypothetical protein
MTQEDKQEIAKLLKDATPWNRINLSGILQALIIAGILGVWTRLEQLAQTDIARNERIEVIQKNIEELKEAAKAPRFSKSDFDLSMQPFRQSLDIILKDQEILEQRLESQRRRLEEHITSKK